MNTLTTKIFTILFLCFFTITTKAQVQKGFELLKEKNYAAALKAFQEDTDSRRKKGAAELGCVYCEITQTPIASWKQLRQQADRIKIAELNISKLSPKRRDKLRKAGYYENFVKELKTTLQKQSLELLKYDRTVVGIDTFKAVWKNLDTKVNKEFRSVREQIVLNRLNSNDYLDIRSIVKNHGDVFKKKILQMPDFDRSLIFSFLTNYPLHDIGKFKTDFPKHSINYDCYWTPFLKAVESKKLDEILQFMDKYPLSILDEYVVISLNINSENAFLLEQKNSLSAKDKMKFEALQQNNAIIQAFIRDKYSSQFSLDSLKSIIKKNAPHFTGYSILRIGLGRLMEQKKWNDCSELISFSQPLFPDEKPNCPNVYEWHINKQKWFATVAELLKKPSEGLELHPLEEINTRADEFSPVISADGKKLFFAAKGRSAANGFSEDIFYSEWKDEKWNEPQMISELSDDERNEAPLSVTLDGNEMLIFSDGELCISQLTHKGWGKPVPLPKAINDLAWVGKATLSADGHVLIFEASKNPDITDKKANVDLYIAFRSNTNTWTTPVALDTITINTKENERSPFLHPDMKTLYFSSNGHDGFAEMDVYKITRLDDTWKKWSAPENLGKEINSMQDDWGYNFSISTDSKTVYLSSGGVAGLTPGDIVSTGIPVSSRAKKVQIITGQLDIKGDTTTRYYVKAIDPATGKVVATVLARPDGTYTFPILDFIPKIVVSAVGKNIISNAITISIDSTKEITTVSEKVKAVSIEKMIIGETSLELRSLVFDVAKADLTDAAKAELDPIIEKIKNITSIIELTGHTDSEGDEASNQALSLQRANVVLNYFIQKGIPSNKLIAKGAGETSPIADNNSAEGRSLNRRVEIRFKKK